MGCGCRFKKVASVIWLGGIAGLGDVGLDLCSTNRGLVSMKRCEIGTTRVFQSGILGQIQGIV